MGATHTLRTLVANGRVGRLGVPAEVMKGASFDAMNGAVEAVIAPILPSVRQPPSRTQPKPGARP